MIAATSNESTGAVMSPRNDKSRKKTHSNDQEEGDDRVEKSYREKLFPPSPEAGFGVPGRPGVCDHVAMLNGLTWSVSKLPPPSPSGITKHPSEAAGIHQEDDVILRGSSDGES